MASDKALSWVFAEEFVEENELLAQAREAATDLGADPVSTGVGAALRLLAATCKSANDGFSFLGVVLGLSST